MTDNICWLLFKCMRWFVCNKQSRLLPRIRIFQLPSPGLRQCPLGWISLRQMAAYRNKVFDEVRTVIRYYPIDTLLHVCWHRGSPGLGQVLWYQLVMVSFLPCCDQLWRRAVSVSSWYTSCQGNPSLWWQRICGTQSPWNWDHDSVSPHTRQSVVCAIFVAFGSNDMFSLIYRHDKVSNVRHRYRMPI